MRNKIIASLAIILTACTGSETVDSTSQETKDTEMQFKVTEYLSAWHGIKIVEIDSCEYIIMKNNEAGGITHKQNCKYCARRH